MKRTYIITYQLGKNSNETAIIKYLKDSDGWARITDNTWAIVTTQKAKEIRDKILAHKGDGGRIFVIKSGKESAWSNTRGRNEWFKNNL
jgi:hypothetical protein